MSEPLTCTEDQNKLKYSMYYIFIWTKNKLEDL